MKGKLYLIPTLLGESDPNYSIPTGLMHIINGLDEFIVENERTARRYLKRIGYEKALQELKLHVLNKHTELSEIPSFLQSAKDGKSIGLLSEAGTPAVADPGADIVTIAHTEGIQVVPLVGPSSILLSLMASGFNGQNFAFVGYLPIDKRQKVNRIKELERRVYQEDQTQIFIETPYRNNQMIKDLIAICKPDTKLCIACDLTLENELIISQPIHLWKRKQPDIHKRPAVFLIFK